MKEKRLHEEIQFTVEGDTYLEEVTLIEDNQKDMDLERPIDIEDFLYETWKESQILKQDDIKGKIEEATGKK
jgi:hypothetical protein